MGCAAGFQCPFCKKKYATKKGLRSHPCDQPPSAEDIRFALLTNLLNRRAQAELEKALLKISLEPASSADVEPRFQIEKEPAPEKGEVASTSDVLEPPGWLMRRRKKRATRKAANSRCDVLSHSAAEIVHDEQDSNEVRIKSQEDSSVLHSESADKIQDKKTASSADLLVDEKEPGEADLGEVGEATTVFKNDADVRIRTSQVLLSDVSCEELQTALHVSLLPFDAVGVSEDGEYGEDVKHLCEVLTDYGIEPIDLRLSMSDWSGVVCDIKELSQKYEAEMCVEDDTWDFFSVKAEVEFQELEMEIGLMEIER